MNPIYNMFNQSYIQQQAQQKHFTQVANIQKSTHKLKDFFDSLDDIEPEYRNEASLVFSTVVFDYINKHSK